MLRKLTWPVLVLLLLIAQAASVACSVRCGQTAAATEQSGMACHHMGTDRRHTSTVSSQSCSGPVCGSELAMIQGRTVHLYSPLVGMDVPAASTSASLLVVSATPVFRQVNISDTSPFDPLITTLRV